MFQFPFFLKYIYIFKKITMWNNQIIVNSTSESMNIIMLICFTLFTLDPIKPCIFLTGKPMSYYYLNTGIKTHYGWHDKVERLPDAYIFMKIWYTVRASVRAVFSSAPPIQRKCTAQLDSRFESNLCPQLYIIVHCH